MGSDLVAVDATSARMIGLDPAQLPYLKDAGRFLGNLDARQIDVRGETFARFATEFDVLDRFKPIRLRARSVGTLVSPPNPVEISALAEIAVPCSSLSPNVARRSGLKSRDLATSVRLHRD